MVAPVTTSPNRTPVPLTYEEVARLATVLTPEMLGYAVRIVSYQAAFGEGMPEQIAPTFLGLTKKRWERVADALKTEFRVEAGRWVLPAAITMAAFTKTTQWAGMEASDMRAPLVPLPQSLKATQATLPLLVQQTPPARATQKPQAVAQSLAQHIYKAGVLLLTKAGRNETQARTCIAKMLKDWDEAPVAETIQAAVQQGELVEPFSWMIARLKEVAPTRAQRKAEMAEKGYSKPRPLVKAARPMASPDFLGVSDGMAHRIRQGANQRPAFQFEEDSESAA